MRSDVVRCARVALAGAIALGTAGCQYLQFLPFLKAPVDTRPRGKTSVARGPAFARGDGVDGDGVAAGADWRVYNGDLTTGQRWSPLAQITAENVSGLRPVCTAELGERVPMQSGPVVVHGTMYVTSAVSTWAIDAATCALRWRHTYRYDPKPDYDLKVNRGVAYAETPDGPRVVRGSNDGRVYAIDARTGEQLWNVLTGDVKRGESFPAAPVAWNGLVYVGNAGGDNYGVTGRVMALDARTGDEVWTAQLVARSGPAAFSWPAETDRVPRAGAATWTSYTLDTARALLYATTGNAAPDFLGELRPGANDHAYSVVAIDARTGEIRRAYKVMPSDFHDWDVAAAPLLVSSAAGRPLVVAAGKDGYVYAFDRESGERRYRTPVTTIDNAEAPITPNGTHFCPGVQGGVEWNGPAYSPRTNALYVGAVDWCSTVWAGDPGRLKGRRGIPWTGTTKRRLPFGKVDPKASARGWLTALDADSGTVRWKYQSPTPLVAGVTATAGGLVFSADLRGDVFALDAATGAERFRYNVGQPVGGGVVSYAAGGKQYIAVAAGLHAPMTWQTKTGKARVVVFGVP